MNKKFILLTIPLILFGAGFNSLSASAVAPVQTTVYCPAGDATSSNQCQWFFQDLNGGMPGGQVAWYDVGYDWNRTINHESVGYKDLNFRFNSDLMPDRVKDPNGLCDVDITLYFKGHWAGLEPIGSFDIFDHGPAGWQGTNSQVNGSTLSGVFENESQGSLNWCLNFDTLTNLQNGGWWSFWNNGTNGQYPFMYFYNSQNNNAPYTVGVAGIELEYWTDNANTASTNALIAMESYMASDAFKNNQAEIDLMNALNSSSEANDLQSGVSAKLGLLDTVTTLATILNNANDTGDCRLSSIQLYSLDLGKLDMCSMSIPQQFNPLIGLMFAVPLALMGVSIIFQVLHLVEKYTGGKK